MFLLPNQICLLFIQVINSFFQEFSLSLHQYVAVNFSVYQPVITRFNKFMVICTCLNRLAVTFFGASRCCTLSFYMQLIFTSAIIFTENLRPNFTNPDCIDVCSWGWWLSTAVFVFNIRSIFTKNLTEFNIKWNCIPLRNISRQKMSINLLHHYSRLNKRLHRNGALTSIRRDMKVKYKMFMQAVALLKFAQKNQSHYFLNSTL